MTKRKGKGKGKFKGKKAAFAAKSPRIPESGAVLGTFASTYAYTCTSTYPWTWALDCHATEGDMISPPLQGPARGASRQIAWAAGPHAICRKAIPMMAPRIFTCTSGFSGGWEQVQGGARESILEREKKPWVKIDERILKPQNADSDPEPWLFLSVHAGKPSERPMTRDRAECSP